MKINTLRVSFVFSETILDLQAGTGRAMPLAGFVTEPGYVDTVDTLRRGEAVPLDLRLPWPYPGGQHFWGNYLDEKEPGDAPGKLCFERLMPLRLPKLVDKIGTVLAEDVRIGMEGFYFPHGTGLLVNATLTGAFDGSDAGRHALQLRYETIYEPVWPGTDRAQPLNIEQLAAAALDRLRQSGFGVGVSGTRSKLYSIATVVRGMDVDPIEPLAPDGPVHRLLNGLAGWVPGWQDSPAPLLEAGKTQLRLKTSTARPGNVIFAGKRGLAVWFPSLFDPSAPRAHGLSCYHRNLCFGSLQAASLLALAAAVQGKFAQPAPVPNSIQRFGRLAAGLLGRLHGGVKTYRSDSLRAQIAQAAELPDVNGLRQRFGMKPDL